MTKRSKNKLFSAHVMASNFVQHNNIVVVDGFCGFFNFQVDSFRLLLKMFFLLPYGMSLLIF